MGRTTHTVVMNEVIFAGHGTDGEAILLLLVRLERENGGRLLLRA